MTSSKIYVVAVSGGVDSVVLLDMLASSEHRLAVAHVDHGIRPESGDDAEFVRALAKTYRLPYVSTELNLGSDASEEQARNARYGFLAEQAKKFHGQIVTAHHQDDVIGSIAINLSRGTGWRGLAVMNRRDIKRPLLGWTKRQIYDYALKHRLEWVEDSTNSSDAYLRNRLRAGVLALNKNDSAGVIKLRAHQLQLAHDIDHEAMRLVQMFGGRRHPYVQLDTPTAVELLRHHVQQAVNYRPSALEAERILLAIKTAKAGTVYDISGGLVVRCSRNEFFVENPR